MFCGSIFSEMKQDKVSLKKQHACRYIGEQQTPLRDEARAYSLHYINFKINFLVTV